MSFHRQLGEIGALMVCSRLGPGNYHKYRLWQASIPWKEKLGYWHDQKYYAFLDRVNPYSYRIMARNKVLAKALLRFYGIPDAEYIAFFSRHGGVSANGSEIASLDDLGRVLGENAALSRVCFKPVEGSGGDGFCAAEIMRDRETRLRSLADGAELSVPEYIERYLGRCLASDYIVESYLEQHPALAEFNPSSLNTLRVWVGRSRNGQIEILGAYLRVGRAGCLVDNRLSGGFGIAVDFDTFMTRVAIPQDGKTGQAFRDHPDSGIDMGDRQLPFRKEVIDLSRRVLEVLPSTQFVGLDVAFTPDRPVLIEFNLAPSAIGASVIGKSHASLLGDIGGEG